MFARLRSSARSAVQSIGYDVHRVREHRDPFIDLRVALPSNPSPIIFDVGANVGQTIKSFRSIFPGSTIHAFEPSAEVFTELEKNAKGNGIHLNNFAVGARPEIREFIEMTGSEQNSFLEFDKDGRGYGTAKGRTPVSVCTIDDYCRANKIERIHVFKPIRRASTWKS